MSTKVEVQESVEQDTSSKTTSGKRLNAKGYGESAKDWIKHLLSVDDNKVIHDLMSMLPFYPESDGKRKLEVIDTEISGGNIIKEVFIENLEPERNGGSTLQMDKSNLVKDVVLLHGYAAASGLFIYNFDSLSSVPGIRIHALDLLGFGFSSRPTFPKFKVETKEDIYKIEDWFIDAIEEWRKKRKIDRFILMGHSFGGYLSCAYVLKYNKLLGEHNGLKHRMVDKLVLVSPVGVERNKNSLLKDLSNAKCVDATTKIREDKTSPEVRISEEVEQNQEKVVKNDPDDIDASTRESLSKKRRLFDYMWNQHFSPFTLVRNLGPIKLKAISNWTERRFATVYRNNPAEYYIIHDYFYRIFNGKGSGEYAITRVLAPGALPRLPLIDRCPENFVNMGLPSFWMYGDNDWMNRDAGREITDEINKLASKTLNNELAKFSILRNAGHHLYLDNPTDFASQTLSFMGFNTK